MSSTFHDSLKKMLMGMATRVCWLFCRRSGVGLPGVAIGDPGLGLEVLHQDADAAAVIAETPTSGDQELVG